jgi:magnesium transporter
VDLQYDEDSVGRLMERPAGVFRPETTVAEAVERLRELVQRTFITYVFVTDAGGRLVGVLAFRELLFARPDQRLDEIMLRDPFSLKPDTPLVDAMRTVVTRHYPAYPVTDGEGRLVGMVRGQALFERQAYEISAQAGSMVGVEKEERVGTHWLRSFKFRHPWLQLNLLTAFVAAAVVGIFQDTIDRVVVLAAFLPVLAGQSGNSGCQALAVTLRGITLGDLRNVRTRRLVLKEAWVGLLNGLLVGLVAGVGMWFYARSQHNGSAVVLGLVVWFAMTASCAISGVAGALVPLILRRLGADPATASSIFLTTATDVCSMGLLLALATALVR